MNINEQISSGTTLQGNALNHLFQENVTSVLNANLNMELTSIIGTLFCVIIGSIITIKAIQNFHIIIKQHKNSISNEFDLTNNRTARTEEMDETLKNGNRNSKGNSHFTHAFRRWITEPPSMTEVGKIRQKRYIKAFLNIAIALLGGYLVLGPSSPIIYSLITNPYSIEFHEKNIIIKNVMNTEIVNKEDIKEIQYKRKLNSNGKDYFYPRCEIIIDTINGQKKFIAKKYDMEKIRLKDC